MKQNLLKIFAITSVASGTALILMELIVELFSINNSFTGSSPSFAIGFWIMLVMILSVIGGIVSFVYQKVFLKQNDLVKWLPVLFSGYVAFLLSTLISN